METPLRTLLEVWFTVVPLGFFQAVQAIAGLINALLQALGLDYNVVAF